MPYNHAPISTVTHLLACLFVAACGTCAQHASEGIYGNRQHWPTKGLPPPLQDVVCCNGVECRTQQQQQQQQWPLLCWQCWLLLHQLVAVAAVHSQANSKVCAHVRCVCEKPVQLFVPGGGFELAAVVSMTCVHVCACACTWTRVLCTVDTCVCTVMCIVAALIACVFLLFLFQESGVWHVQQQHALHNNWLQGSPYCQPSHCNDVHGVT